jgi:t-SNARE complex subunit (syntaxin)
MKATILKATNKSIEYSPLNNNQKSIQIKNQRYKIIQEAKRTWLNIHLNAYIIKIQAYDQQYQNEFRQLESQIMNDNNRTTTNDTNSSSLLNKIKDYLTNRTNRLKEEIYNQISSSSYRMKLVQNRQRSSSTKTIIGVSPEPYLDLLCNPLNTCQWDHLLLGKILCFFFSS